MILLCCCCCCCDKVLTNINLEGHILHSVTPRSHPFTETSQEKQSRQEPWGRNWSRIHGGTCFRYLLLCAFYTTHGHSRRDTTTHNGLGLSDELSIKNQEQRLDHRSVWWRQFFDSCCLFPDGSSLYQVDKKHLSSNKHSLEER